MSALRPSHCGPNSHHQSPRWRSSGRHVHRRATATVTLTAACIGERVGWCAGVGNPVAVVLTGRFVLLHQVQEVTEHTLASVRSKHLETQFRCVCARVCVLPLACAWVATYVCRPPCGCSIMVTRFPATPWCAQSGRGRKQARCGCCGAQQLPGGTERARGGEAG